MNDTHNPESEDATTDREPQEAGFFKSRFPEIEFEHLVLLTAETRGWGFAPAEGRETYLGVFVVKEKLKGDRRLLLSKRLIEAGDERGICLYPTIYEQSEWRELERQHEGHQWTEMLAPGAGAQHAIAMSKADGVYPRRVRRQLLGLLGAHISMVHTLVESSPEQHAHYVPVLSRMVQETFESVFAVSGKQYRGDHRDIEQFDDALSQQRYFKETDIHLVPYLVALADQTRHLRLVSKDNESQACLEAANVVLDFLKRTKVFVAAELKDEQEKKRTLYARHGLIGAGAVLVAAVALLVWAVVSPTDIGSPAKKAGRRGGISASYFQGENFDRLVDEKNVEQIGVPRWTSPVPGVKPDHYSVRWEGYLEIEKTGVYTICTDNDDGVAVYINDKKVVSDWVTHPPKKNCARIEADAVGWYPLKVDYYEDIGPGSITLSLGKTEKTAVPVTASQLCCRGRSTRKK